MFVCWFFTMAQFLSKLRAFLIYAKLAKQFNYHRKPKYKHKLTQIFTINIHNDRFILVFKLTDINVIS